jgi:APA family basic amino acid/polyamine antiporter
MDSTAGPAQLSEIQLVRAVSRWEIVGLAINDVIGSGVYLLPAAAAMSLGAASVIAVGVAGLAVGLLVLCFAEAASYFEQTGGGYLYTREAFGEFVGFEVGWMTWIARVASVAALSAGFAQASGFLWPAAAEGWRRAAIITLPLGLLTWVNFVGVKHGARVAVGLAIAKTLPLILFVVAGVFAVDWSRVADVRAPSLGSLGEAALLLLFAYAGFENTAAPAGEYQYPKRHVPFALLIMIALILALSGSFVALAKLSIIARLATYIGTAAAVPVLRRRFQDRPDALRLPGGVTIPLAALVVCLGLLASATPADLIAAAAMLVGILIYRCRRPLRV